MKSQKCKFISIYAAIFLIFMQASYAENEFYSTDYGAMAYVIIPFGGGDANTSPILGLTGSKVEFNELYAAFGNRGSGDESFIYKRTLIDIMYDWDDQRLSRFNLGGVNALDSGILNIDGGGIKPVAALIGAGLAVGGIIVASEAGGGDDDNHVCAHEEEEHHDFAFVDYDAIFNVHPCPEGEEEEEGGHGH